MIAIHDHQSTFQEQPRKIVKLLQIEIIDKQHLPAPRFLEAQYLYTNQGQHLQSDREHANSFLPDQHETVN